MDFESNLVTRIKAGFALFYCRTHEEDRLIGDIVKVGKSLKYNVLIWSRTSGFTHRLICYPKTRFNTNAEKRDLSPDEMDCFDAFADFKNPDIESKLDWIEQFRISVKGMIDPVDAVKWTQSQALPPRSLVVMLDYYHYFSKPESARACRDVLPVLSATFKKLIFTGVKSDIPKDLEKCVALIDYTLPDQASIDQLIQSTESDVKTKIPDELRSGIVAACSGLGSQEIQDILSLCWVRSNLVKEKEDRGWSSDILNTIYDEKTQVIQKSGLLTYVRNVEDMSSVGGMSGLKDWIRKRKSIYTNPVKAKDFGLQYPKGCLLVGVPGTGKSMAAKAIAAELQLPLISLDMGKLFGKFVGDSEHNAREVIAQVDGMNNTVLVLDEVEKSLGGSSGDQSHEVSKRILGIFLTWMAEKQTPTFVVMTANRVSSLPPELTRVGRLEKIWLIDLPTEPELREIWQIHIKKAKRNPEKYDINKLAKMTKGYTGAEIEQIVTDALTNAFFEEKQDVTNKHLELAAKSIRPQSETMKEEMDEMKAKLERVAYNAGSTTKELVGFKTEKTGRAVEV